MHWFLLLLLFAGCSAPGVVSSRQLYERQNAVQDCILSGGTPMLGPGQAILCD